MMRKVLTSFILVFLALNVNAQQVVQVADINVGAGSSYPFGFVEFNNEMYFSANSGTGYEIWKYDGVNAPTMVADSNTISSLYPLGFESFNNKMYFVYADVNTSMGDGIWMYDGVNQLTHVAELNPTGHDFNVTNTDFFTAFNGKLYFAGTDGITGEELWEYDGVNAPSLVADLNTNPAPNNSSIPRGMTVFQNKLYFVALDGTTEHLMVYDGVNAPSIVYSNVQTYSYGSMAVHNNKLYFNALSDSLSSFSATLFEYDGIATPIPVTPNLGAAQSYYLGAIDATFFGNLYIRVVPSSGGLWEYWQYDGINPASYVGDSLEFIGTTGVLYNNEVYYTGSDATYGYELWKYDGINAPVRLTDINTNGNSTASDRTFAFQDKIYFTATDGTTGNELWFFDPNYLSISQIENGNISLYPNPTTSDITIQFDQAYNKANIELINTLGQVIMSKQSNDMVTNIAMPQEQGIYFVRITINGKSTSQKVVKQ